MVDSKVTVRIADSWLSRIVLDLQPFSSYFIEPATLLLLCGLKTALSFRPGDYVYYPTAAASCTHSKAAALWWERAAAGADDFKIRNNPRNAFSFTGPAKSANAQALLVKLRLGER